MPSKRLLITAVIVAVAAFSILFFIDTSQPTSLKDATSSSENESPVIAHNNVPKSKIEQSPTIANKTHLNAISTDNITKCNSLGAEYDENYALQSKLENARLRENIKDLNSVESDFVLMLTADLTVGEIIKNTTLLSEKDPDNQLLAYHLLSECSSNSELCSDSLISQISEKLTDNSAVWLLNAIYYADKGNIDSVEQAIIEASKAPDFDSYWHSYVAAISDAYDQAGDKGTQMQDEIKMGYISAIAVPSYGSLFKVCEQASIEKLTLIEACLTAGRLLTRDSKTLITKSIGYSMQETALVNLDREDELSFLSTDKQAHKALYTSQAKAVDLLWRNTSLRHQMLRQLMEHGEIAYAQFAIEEAIKLSNAPDVDECQVVP